MDLSNLFPGVPVKNHYNDVSLIFGPDRIKFIEDYPPDERIEFSELRLVVRYKTMPKATKKYNVAIVNVKDFIAY